MAKICQVCDEKIPLGTATKIVDGIICPLCSQLSANNRTETIATMKSYKQQNADRVAKFNKTSVLKSLMSECVVIDGVSKLFYRGDEKSVPKFAIVYRFDEVSEYNFEQVGGKTITKSKGGIGRAVVGGALFGGVGAVVGASTSKKETKTVGGVNLLKITLDTYSGKNTLILRNPPNGLIPFLDSCIDEVQEEHGTTISTADEIQKFKSLLDQGAITQEEFEAKKKQLLNL